MQPEAFAPRFIATDHGRRVRQTQAAFALDDFIAYARAHTSSPHVQFDVGDAQAMRYESGRFDRTCSTAWSRLMV